MLLNNVRPDESDCFYFLYRFALRSWFLLLSVTFSQSIAGLLGRAFTGGQYLTMLGAFALIVVVDFLSIWIKAYPIYKEQARIEWESNGRRKTH